MADAARILVVEDDRALRDLYVLILRDAGFTVDEAPDGEAALAFLQKGGYDLVLLDIVLPKMDGIKILESLKQNIPDYANKKIVVLSNLGHDEIIGNAVALGAAGYLIKSDYTPDQIVLRVREFLNGK
ncbi:MAG: two-component system, chemotaxis family, response regulator CheY [Microgenomates group bacterium Gr01-1014_16]|nr:MAG: two-component system, chemotaxis family, response regulator CheY [Microgenomates group bacterium Gr01-1014_16]